MTPVLPRYVVGQVTGWKVSASSLNSGSRRPTGNPPTLWCVQDRLFCHRTVADFITGGGMSMRAHNHCDKLNRDYERWLADEGLL